MDTLPESPSSLPGEIERVVEGDAFELNAVIIANRKSHAELLALLEKKDVGVGLDAIEKWRLRRAPGANCATTAQLKNFGRTSRVKSS